MLNMKFIFGFCLIFLNQYFVSAQDIVWKYSFNEYGQLIIISQDSVMLGSKFRENITILNLNTGEELKDKIRTSEIFPEVLILNDNIKSERIGRKAYYYMNVASGYKYDKIVFLRKQRFFRWGRESHKLYLYNNKKKIIRFSKKYNIYDIKIVAPDKLLFYYLSYDKKGNHYEVVLMKI